LGRIFSVSRCQGMRQALYPIPREGSQGSRDSLTAAQRDGRLKSAAALRQDMDRSQRCPSMLRTAASESTGSVERP
jgi:hypothetical protein